MGAFEEFVESDLFFPILIGMLLLLITVFVVILRSDKKHEKEYKKEIKKESNNDSLTKTVQIPIQPQVVKQVVVTKKEEQPVVIQPEVKEEIKEEIVETPVKEESKELDLSHTVAPTIIKENPVKPKVVERTEIAEDAPVVDLKIADTSSDESLEATQVVQIVEENNEDEEIIVPEAVKQIEEDEGEEIEAPEKAIAIEEEGEKIISDSEPDEIKQVEVEQPNAFDVKSDGNIDINEDIKYEPPKEYTGVKTEVLDLSDINKEE